MPTISKSYIKKQWTAILIMHVIAFTLHSVAVGLTVHFTKGEATIPITTFFPDSSFKPDLQSFHNMPSGYLTIAYSLPSAIEHLLSFILLINNDYTQYTDYLTNNADILRWISYSISAPIMMVQISMRSGVFDPLLLTAVAFLYNTMMLLGYITEHLLLSDKGQHASYSYTPLFCGWVPFTGAWIIVFVYFFKAASSGSAPTFVYVIVIGEFVIMCIFGLVLWYAVYNRKELSSKPNYTNQFFVIRIVMSYIILSLTAKLFLATLNWYGSQSV
jgi:hypothetical protein